ncbi:MAG: ester cyclase [Chloroflexi bacterium]|nr:MAG: ester cyclase [Chloroflexota bacterium]
MAGVGWFGPERAKGRRNMGRFETVAKAFVDAINRGDLDAVTASYSENCTVEDPMYPAPLVGRNAVREDAAAFLRGFPDLRLELGDLLEKGDIGMAEYRITGTNTGPLTTPMGEVPATGKRLDVHGSVYARLNDRDLTVEEHRHYDVAGVMRALGLMPEPEAATVAAR